LDLNAKAIWVILQSVCNNLTRRNQNQKDALKNPKFEYRNSKQIQNPNFSKLKTHEILKHLLTPDLVLAI